MADYERSTSVEAPADRTFEWLADPRNMPAYTRMLVLADPIPDGVHIAAATGDGMIERDVDVKADPIARRFEWHPRGSEYHGQMTVTEAPGGSRVTLRLHTTERVEPAQADEAIRYTLNRIREGAAVASRATPLPG
jgi:hypothetical protein